MKIRPLETLRAADLAAPTAAGGKILPLRRRRTAGRQARGGRLQTLARRLLS